MREYVVTRKVVVYECVGVEAESKEEAIRKAEEEEPDYNWWELTREEPEDYDVEDDNPPEKEDDNE